MFPFSIPVPMRNITKEYFLMISKNYYKNNINRNTVCFKVRLNLKLFPAQPLPNFVTSGKLFELLEPPFLCKITIIIILTVSVWIIAVLITSKPQQEINKCCVSLLPMARYVGKKKTQNSNNKKIMNLILQISGRNIRISRFPNWLIQKGQKINCQKYAAH